MDRLPHRWLAKNIGDVDWCEVGSRPRRKRRSRAWARWQGQERAAVRIYGISSSRGHVRALFLWFFGEIWQSAV